MIQEKWQTKSYYVLKGTEIAIEMVGDDPCKWIVRHAGREQLVDGTMGDAKQEALKLAEQLGFAIVRS